MKLLNRIQNIPCQNIKFFNCRFTDNGQRDIINGGTENTNGHGCDCFGGGDETVFDGCYFARNAGAGVVQKGNGFVSVGMVINNCLFEHMIPTEATPSGGHGIELGTTNGRNQRGYKITNNTIRYNNGTGIFAPFLNGGNMSNNAVYGNNIGVRLSEVDHIDICNNTVCGNFSFNYIIGFSDNVNNRNASINIRGGLVSGVWNPAGPLLKDINNISFTGEFNGETNQITGANHGLVDRDCVSLRGDAPGTLEERQYYYVKVVDENTFELTRTPHLENDIAAPSIEFDASGSCTVSTNHTSSNFRSYQSINDILIEGTTFYPGHDRRGCLMHGNRIKIKNARFFQFTRAALQLRGTVLLEDVLFQDYDLDGGANSWSPIMGRDGTRLTMNRVEFLNTESNAPSAIRLEGDATLKHSSTISQGFNVVVNNLGTGTVEES